MQTDFVLGMRRQVGWFVILGGGALLLMLLIVSIRTDVFATKFSLFFSPPSATSFYAGQPVKFHGFAIGRVDEIELLEQGRVRIAVELLERYRHMLHEGARARLIKEGLIGEQVVEITAGNAKGRMLRDRESIAYETEATLEQLLVDIKPAVADANTLLSELAQLATWLNDPEGDVRQAMAGLRALGSGLKAAEIEESVRRLTSALKRVEEVAGQMSEHEVARRLASSLETTNRMLINLEPLSEELRAKGPETVAHVNALLSHVDELSRSLDIVARDLAELTPELPGLARESRSTLQEMRRMLRGLRGSWLFGGTDEEPAGEEGVAPPVLESQP